MEFSIAGVLQELHTRGKYHPIQNVYQTFGDFPGTIASELWISTAA